MQFQRIHSLPMLLLLAQAACTSVYVPPNEPLTETGLAEAIALLQATDERVEVLEDGLQLEVYFYEWRPLPQPARLDIHRGTLNDSLFSESQRTRMLAGPRRSVYLPYASIGAVAARSWPLWSGVELEVLEAGVVNLAGPVVIRADDAEEAARLSDAIELARRARSSVPDRVGSTSPAD
jgi:hypothetical protein